MTSRPFYALALATASVALVGGVAYAAVQSVDTSPTPQVVIPAASSSATDDARQGADDPATHDVGDDHGGLTGSDDDPATHDVGDDHGGLTGSDDDGTDDSGNSGPGSDDSLNSGPGSDDSTSGSDDSGSGSDDSGSGSDDSGH
jgi:hypothetical protein